MAFGQSVIWPKLGGPPGERWLWGRHSDLAWIAGGGFFAFVLVAFPLSFWAPSAPLLTTAFLHLAIVCNYPHYGATYETIVRERVAKPRAFHTLLVSTPIMIALAALVASFPDLLWAPVLRLYLCWSMHHYAAQNFGISAMWAGRSGTPLAGREKTLLQFAFLGLGVFLIVVSNTAGGDPESAAKVVGLAGNGGEIPIANLPDAVYPLALCLAAACIGAFAFAERARKARIGAGFDRATWLLFLTSLAWFVVPAIRLPGSGEPWMWPGLRLALLGAPPFFHCAQYLAVVGHRDRQTSDVRPIVLFSMLVFGSFALFHGPPAVLPMIFPIDSLRAILLVVAVINLHHFWLDGVMWRRPKKAAASVLTNASAPAL